MNSNIEKTNLNQLISKLKKRDNRKAKLNKIAQNLYWVLILPLFTIWFISEDKENFSWAHATGSMFFVLGIIIVTLGFRNNYKNFKSIDYSLPTLKVLKDAVKRHAFFYGKKTYAILIICAAQIAFFLRDFGKPEYIHLQLVFIPGMCIGFFIGFNKWKILYKPIRDNAKKLIEEIEGE